MAFVQIIELTTKKFEGLEELNEQWRQATEGARTLRREVVTRDRNNPDRYLLLAFFDSYESAMENSSLAATQEIAARFGEFVDGPITFHDLDVIEDRS